MNEKNIEEFYEELELLATLTKLQNKKKYKKLIRCEETVLSNLTNYFDKYNIEEKNKMINLMYSTSEFAEYLNL